MKKRARLSDTLGSIAANAIYERDRVEQQERAAFPKLLLQHWVGMRPLMFGAAQAGKTTGAVKFDMRFLKLKVFEPSRKDFLANLPEELAEMHQAEQLAVYPRDDDSSGPIFKLHLGFKSNTDEHMAKLKRTGGAGEASEEKKPKTEVKKEPL